MIEITMYTSIMHYIYNVYRSRNKFMRSHKTGAIEIDIYLINPDIFYFVSRYSFKKIKKYYTMSTFNFIVCTE